MSNAFFERPILNSPYEYPVADHFVDVNKMVDLGSGRQREIEESFFVRHAYFLGANDPYKSLKTTLKAEIDEDAWATLHSDASRPFAKPRSGRIAVKVTITRVTRLRKSSRSKGKVAK